MTWFSRSSFGLILVAGLGLADVGFAQAPVVTEPIRQGTLGIALQIEDFFQRANLGRQTQLGVSVLDVQRGSTVVDIQSGRALVPASVMKLATATVALEILGADHRFLTTIETTGSVEGEILYGDLILRGGGDPTLGPRFYEGRRQGVSGQLEDWAHTLRSQGIRVIEGNIVGDDTRYPVDRHAIGWDQREFGEWYSAEVSALTYNENVVDIFWRTGSRTGDRATFTTDPVSSYFQIGSSVRTGPQDQRFSRIRYSRFATSNEIRARGSMPPNSRLTDFAAIHDPARYTATLMADALKKAGVVVKGVPISKRDLGELEPQETTVLIEHLSPNLGEILPVILGDSHNLYAELVLREAAAALGKPATFRAGAEVVTQWMIQNRLHRSGFTMVDGSGLSPINRMAPRMVTGILLQQAKGEDAAVWRESLATPGRRSLVNRFSSTDEATFTDAPIQGKTGYITGVHSLAGYFTAKNGRDYAFAIFVTDYDPERLIEARNFIDRTVATLCESELLQ